MNYHLDVALQVDRDIKRIADWYREKSGYAEVGDEWAAGVIAAIESLVENPHRHALAHESEMLDFELCELHYGSGRRPTHRVLFRISGDVVEVSCVRHTAQQTSRRRIWESELHRFT